MKLIRAHGAQLTPLERGFLSAGVWAATGSFTRTAEEDGHLLASLCEDRTLLRRAMQHKMAPMLFEFVRACNMRVDGTLAELAWIARTDLKALYEGLEPTVRRLGALDIPLVILKGGDLALSTYPVSLPRTMIDIDILVLPADLPSVVRTLRDDGYIQGSFDPERLRIDPLADSERRALEKDHYELVAFKKIVSLDGLHAFRRTIEEWLGPRFMVRNGTVYRVVDYDVHHTISRMMELEDVWDCPRSITLPSGSKVLAQSATNLLWLLALRCYIETLTGHKPCLRQFIDVLAVVARLSDAVDWARLVEMSEKYEMWSELFYVLWHANELLERGVPADLLASHTPGRRSGSFRDLGDFMPRMFDRVVVHSLL